ncbi:MAG: YCF48-related protein [Bacteroidota bacterium]|nr:YCF48-related protein [Bacteroidota bacterium]
MNLLYFLNDNYGWVTTLNNKVLKTTNGGKSWTKSLLTKGNFQTNSIHFIDKNTGYLVGSAGYPGTVSSYAEILYTTDGGSQWKVMPHPFDSSPGPFDAIYDVYFVSSDTGYIAYNSVYKTTDHGKNWKRQSGLQSVYRFMFLDSLHAWGISNYNILSTNDGWGRIDCQSHSATNNTLYSISAKDSLNIAACGGDGVIKTIDGGLTWTKAFNNISPDIIYFRGINYCSNNQIWAVGNKSTIIHSKDDGLTWDKIQLTDSLSILYDISFLDNSTGYIVGKDDTGGVIYKTTDGGISWMKALSYPKSALVKIKFPKPQLGWIVSNSTILRSTDKGVTWQEQKLSYDYNHYPSFAALGDYAWFPNGKFLHLTTDAGLTWKKSAESQSEAISAVSFSDINNGFCGTAEGSLLHTTDGGMTWADIEYITRLEFFSAAASPRNNAWLVGSGGKILHYGTLLTSVTPEGKSTIKEYSLSQNFPNPFNPTTTIIYNIKEQVHVELKIYDILGREILTLVNKVQSAGKYKVLFDGSKLKSGVYLYTIQAGAFRNSKKLLLIK